MFTEALEDEGSSWDDVVARTLNDDQMESFFDNGLSDTDRFPFALWTADRVYYTCKHLDAEWVGSAPRNPCSQDIKNVHGG